MKVALVHDHLAQAGGAEKVLEVFAEMFPEAPIYTLLYEKDNVEKHFRGRHIETSVIQKLPGGIKHYQWYLPFMPLAVEFFDLRGYDLVISDASAFAKGVITSVDTRHICYCHTPTRYLWNDTHQYINELKYNRWFKKIISLALSYIRLWDKIAADRVDFFIANSSMVKKRINKYYRREAVVIYPPVETDKFSVSPDGPKKGKEAYFLCGCRLAPYKRVDLAIEAFNALDSSYRLKIFGDGVDRQRLEKLAAGNDRIEFLGRVSDEEKALLYRQAEAYINPQEEDFGITAVESLASGRPVIAYAKGGALETVIKGENGIFFSEQSSDSLKRALEDFRRYNFDPLLIRQSSLKFSVENFRRQIEEFLAANR
jgi:glycosyltransferase involved in cell wall biosynthesis